MKIIVLTGSPRENGNSNRLADSFCHGAKTAGHEIQRFDTAALDIRPCKACDWCRSHGGHCLLSDGMQQIYPHLAAADMVALVTPLYYYGIAAQLKAAIDRFYAVNSQLYDREAVFLCACAETDLSMTQAIQDHFHTLCRFLRWQNRGVLIASGVENAGEVEHTSFLADAESLGASI